MAYRTRTPSPPAVLPPRWASRDDVAVYVDVTTRTVDRWIAQGLFPCHRIGPKLVRVNLNDVDAAMQRLASATSGS